MDEREQGENAMSEWKHANFANLSEVITPLMTDTNQFPQPTNDAPRDLCKAGDSMVHVNAHRYDELLQAETERAYWKAMHDEQVRRKRVVQRLLRDALDDLVLDGD